MSAYLLSIMRASPRVWCASNSTVIVWLAERSAFLLLSYGWSSSCMDHQLCACTLFTVLGACRHRLGLLWCCALVSNFMLLISPLQATVQRANACRYSHQ